MNIFSNIFIFLSAFLLFASAIAFFRAKDVFAMSKIVMIANCYIVPLLLIAIEVERFSVSSFFKVIGLIILNIVIANLVCHLCVKRASLNSVEPDTAI